MISTANINSYWASLVVEELVRLGVTQFYISPGSRSTPLTVAAVRHEKAQCSICHDERGAAFQALGYAKATFRPAALICTSGTAAANYYPAVIEAAMDFVPLLVLGADRPPELLDTGANQTIFQHHLFGQYVRWFFQMPTPDRSISPEFVLTTIDQAVSRTMHPPAGPVHLNFMFREPLEPRVEPFSTVDSAAEKRWRTSDKPHTVYQVETQRLDAESIQTVLDVFQNSEHGLIVLGRLQPTQQASGEILELIQHLGWPVYADIASGFRLGHPDLPHIKEFELDSQSEPDTVLHLGGPILSKRVQHWLSSTGPANYVQVHAAPNRLDPNHKVTHRIVSGVTAFCELLTTHWVPRTTPTPKEANSICKAAINTFFENTSELSEPLVARLVSQLLPNQHGLALGNSMPVRDMNMYADYNGSRARVGTNRGASGIDGNLASAVGFAAGLQQAVTLLIGDVAFLHDINSLQLVKQSRYPMQIICLNNNGGGIFSFLPISQYEDVFQFFETPHHRHFEHAARLFDLNYFRPKTKHEFITVYKRALTDGTSTIIEMNTTTQENSKLHHDLERHIQIKVKKIS